SERPEMPPRGLIVGTGEQHPPGQSVLARTVILELDGGDIDFPTLDAAQAEAGRLPHAMAGYIEWLAPQMTRLPEFLSKRFTEVRRHVTVAGTHLRVPEAVAHLWLGVEMAFDYGVEIGALTAGAADALKKPMWEALASIGHGQAYLVAEER